MFSTVYSQNAKCSSARCKLSVDWSINGPMTSSRYSFAYWRLAFITCISAATLNASLWSAAICTTEHTRTTTSTCQQRSEVVILKKLDKNWSYQKIFMQLNMQKHTHTHTHTHPFNGPFSGTTQVSRYQKVKPIRILLNQETVSGSGISWAICKSALCSRQITMPAPHHSVFTGRMPFLPPNQQRQSTEGKCRN